MLGFYAAGAEAFGELLDADPPPVVVITGKIGAIGQFSIGQQSSQSSGTVFTETITVACATAVAFVKQANKIVAAACAGSVASIKGVAKTITVAAAGAVSVIAGAVFPQSILVFCSTASSTVLTVGKVVSATLSATVAMFVSYWRSRSEQSEAWVERTEQLDTWTERSEDSEEWRV